MPALLEAPVEQNPFADLVPKDIIGGENGAPAQQIVGGRFSAVPKAEINTPTDYGAFSDLIPAGGNPAGAQDFGLFQDLVPPSPTSETEKAVAATPVMSDFDKKYLDFEKKVQTPMLPPGSFHATMNALRSLSAGAGKYIFEGLQGFEQNRAKMLANPPSEMTVPQADEIVLPDGSVMSQEQQNELEKRYHDAAVSQIPDAKSQADYFKQIAQNADTSQYIDPELANTIPARIAHAAGSAGVMALESLVPYAGIPLMVYHGALATEAEAKNAGKTDAEAEAAGVRSAIGLALFGGASKLAALGVSQLLPEGASTVTKFLSQFLGQETANETSSRAINAWGAASDAPDGKRIEAALNALKDTTLEQSTLNTVYALAHASNAVGKEAVRPASASEPKIQAETPEITPATTGESIEQAPAAEVLKPDVSQENKFVPSTEWQEIPEGAVLPNGGEYRFDQATGKNFARWSPENVKEAQDAAPKVQQKQPFDKFIPELDRALSQSINSEGGAYVIAGGKRLEVVKSSGNYGTRIGDDVRLQDGSVINHEFIDAVETPSGQTLWERAEPIGVADAIAEIQRRNAPAPPLGEHGVSRAAREAAKEIDVTSSGHNSAEAHVERGNKLISAGVIPDEIVQDAITRNAWSSDAVDAAIAKDADLTEKARSARRAADADPSKEAAALEAEKAAQTWEDNAIRPIRGQFHETGMALQSARNLDTGDYIDYSKTFVDKNGRAPDAKEETVLQKATRKIRDLNAADARDLNQLDRTGGRPKKTLDPKRLREELAALKEKMLADCLL